MVLAAVKAWLPFAVVITLFSGVVYGVAQQVLRQTANDPQIQLAEDWADQITFGTEVSRLQMGGFIDPAHSLAPFGIVYDQSGNIANASVTAPSTMAQPTGVFASVDNLGGESRFTWQPTSGDRYAVVIKKTTFQDKAYYVLAGRNLREVEKRTSQVLAITLTGWALGLVAVVAVQHIHVARVAYYRIIKRS